MMASRKVDLLRDHGKYFIHGDHTQGTIQWGPFIGLLMDGKKVVCSSDSTGALFEVTSKNCRKCEGIVNCEIAKLLKVHFREWRLNLLVLILCISASTRRAPWERMDPSHIHIASCIGYRWILGL